MVNNVRASIQFALRTERNGAYICAILDYSLSGLEIIQFRSDEPIELAELFQPPEIELGRERKGVVQAMVQQWGECGYGHRTVLICFPFRISVKTSVFAGGLL